MIDSDILIDDARGVAAAIAFVAGRRVAGPLLVSIVTAMELIQGCRNARDRGRVRQFLVTTAIVPLSASISQVALELMDSYRLSHGLEIADALIAATALEHGHTLFTKNIRDFQMIPGIICVRPY